MLVQVCNAHNFNTITKRNQHEKALYAVNKIQSKLNKKKEKKVIVETKTEKFKYNGQPLAGKK